jgi:hypothetical protein
MPRRRLTVLLAAVLLSVAAGAFATDTLRVGSRVLVVGDSAATVVALLGKPSHKSHPRHGAARGRRVRVIDPAAQRGERWEYRRNGHGITVVLVDGRVADIDDRPH